MNEDRFDLFFITLFVIRCISHIIVCFSKGNPETETGHFRVDIFFNLGFFPRTLTIHRIAGEGRLSFVFLTDNSTRSKFNVKPNSSHGIETSHIKSL